MMRSKTKSKVFISRERRADLSGLAEAVLAEFDSPSVICPEQIAYSSDITISFNDYGAAFDGLLQCRRRRFHIYCNTNPSRSANPARRRFTVAHELGHYFIDDHRTALEAGISPHNSSSFSSRMIVEQEADFFAACLLMPQKRFVQRAMARGLESVLDLSRDFGTSVTSAAVRYAALEISPCAVIKWNPSGYAWKFLSASTLQARFWSTVTKVTDLPPDSPTSRALRGEQAGSGFFQAGTTAAAWFPWLAHDSSRNVMLIEEAVQLGAFGVLTIIRPLSGSFSF